MKIATVKKKENYENIGANGKELISEDQLIDDYQVSQQVIARKDRRVAIFGGGGITPGSQYYEAAKTFAENIAVSEISVVTGGGSGIMEAANKGCYESGSERAISYGIRVKSITYETSNLLINAGYEFETLALRLVSLISSCDVIVCFPGGFGTLEETFSTLVRMRVGMLEKIPVYLYGKKFWDGLVKWIENTLITEGVIDQQDLSLFKVIDDTKSLSQSVIEYIKSLG
jgi:uncharacterized protein (TIGR00730 family)